MIRITINKKKFKGVYSWDDITLQRFCDLAAIPIPEGYEAYILADGNFSIEHIDRYIEDVSKITEKQINEDFPVYYRKVIGCLTDIPLQVIESMTADQVNDTYEYYFKPFVMSLFYFTPVVRFMGQITTYEPPKVKSIRIGSHRFKLPETINIQGQEIALANEPVIVHADAIDIFGGAVMSKNNINQMALFMAIYCRKKGEKYNDRVANERKDLFMKCPMSVVWSVFFYTLRRITNSITIIQLFGSLPKPIREVKDQVIRYKNLVVTV
jgi:hypothetical protein